jgi:hypothetical protein
MKSLMEESGAVNSCNTISHSFGFVNHFVKNETRIISTTDASVSTDGILKFEKEISYTF